MTETQANVAQVPVTVIELAAGEVPGVDPGFYYTIPGANDPGFFADAIPGANDPGFYANTPDPTVPFSGPFNTKQEALEAAAEFVRECLTDFQDEPNVA